jgi:hypothetical protein
MPRRLRRAAKFAAREGVTRPKGGAATNNVRLLCIQLLQPLSLWRATGKVVAEPEIRCDSVSESPGADNAENDADSDRKHEPGHGFMQQRRRQRQTEEGLK